MQTFFCDPHSPWLRGSIENTNRINRRQMPRKMDIAGYTAEDIVEPPRTINSTRRKRLGFNSPAEAFLKTLGG